MSYYMGIDLGTSSVKLYLNDQNGNLLKESSRSYEFSQPNSGWKEIETDLWWNRMCEAVDELLTGIDRLEIKGIGVTGQMHTLILLDENGQVIRPAMMWNDTRTAELIPELKTAMLGTNIEYLTKIISTGSPAANLLWVKKNEKDNFERIKKFLIGPDYIVYRLTGKYGTDYCEASTSSLYDTINKCWSPIMQHLIGLSDDVYPEVKGSAEIAGNILPDVALRFGLQKNTRVIVGTGDNPAASIPTGCLGNNNVVFSMGTSGVLMFERKNLDYEAKGKNILFSFDREHCNILVQGVVQSCGSSFSWWNKDILENNDYKYIDGIMDREKLGYNKVIFYPHLLGDKTIYGDPMLRGAFIGLGTDTSRNDMVQAVMEGIAYALRQLSDEMHLSAKELKELKVIGGGAKSNIWLQILADVMQIKIAQLGGKGGAGYGIALLAAYGCGDIETIENISDSAVEVIGYFYPDKDKIPLYEEGYKKYLKIHDLIKALM